MSNLKIEEKFTVEAPIERVWKFLLSPAQVAGCLPGAQLRGQEGADTYLGTMKIKVGPVTSEFRGKATMSDVDAQAHRLKLSGTGDDTSGGGSARMSMELSVAPAAGGSEVQVVADVEIAGKLVRFGRGMIEGVSKQLFKQFVERARERIVSAEDSEPAPAEGSPAAAPPEAKAEPAPGAQPEAKADAKPDASVETKADAKPEAKAEANREAKTEANGEAKAEANGEAKTEAKTEAKAEAKTEASAEPPAAVKSEEPPAAPAVAAKGEGTDSTAKAAQPESATEPGESKPAAAVTASPSATESKSEGLATDKPAPSRGAAPPPEPSDITTGVLPRPKPRPLAVTVQPKEPEALDAGALIWRALWEWFKGLFRRLLGRGK